MSQEDKKKTEIKMDFSHVVRGRAGAPDLLKKIKELAEKLSITEEELKAKNEKIKELEKETLSKQSRAYLKTVAKAVGKTTKGEPTLFSLPSPTSINSQNTIKEEISRNTAIVGQYLLQLWQEKTTPNNEPLIINNLSHLAKVMNNTNHEIKMYLLYLGGYTYPIIERGENGLSFTVEQLFKITFRYSSATGKRYAANEVATVGTDLLMLIKNEPIQSVEITPNEIFLKALEGNNLGNVLVVSDKFIKLNLSLSDIAYKICSYSASNRPNHTINEESLIRNLGLEKQVKSQGKPRVRKTILQGLQELKEKGYLKSYKYNEIAQMFSFSYSDKYVKHPDEKRKKVKDKNNPTE